VNFRVTKTRRVHNSAHKHGVSIADIEHVMRHPLQVIRREDGGQLYLGAGRNAELLEVIAVLKADGSEIAIHAMKMRARYANLLGAE